jgi:hypothetical protein
MPGPDVGGLGWASAQLHVTFQELRVLFYVYGQCEWVGARESLMVVLLKSGERVRAAPVLLDLHLGERFPAPAVH